MKSRIFNSIKDENGETCDVLFYQGMNSSQTQILKYTGDQKVEATTTEKMWCTGRNNFKPLNVIYKPFIGKEIADVNLRPCKSFSSIINPINWVGSLATWASNKLNGFHFSSPTTPTDESVVFHAPILSKMSIGQETDMASHRQKYDAWKNKNDRTNGLILYGVSRGTAATFCTFAKEKYPEVKLVILEGAIDSVQNVLFSRIKQYFKSNVVSSMVKCYLNMGITLFNKMNMVKYHPEGPSPLKSVDEFPEGIPVVFITSEIDKEVPFINTVHIARTLANKGKNDVYLLKLQNSSHPNYMFDNADDHNKYECFINAIYKKYNLKHDAELAKKGEHLVASSCLSQVKKEIRLDCKS